MNQIECDVVVIDSGITEKCYKDNVNKIVGFKSFGQNNNSYIDNNGHGTAIFSRISEKNNASIFVIKIFDESLEVNEQLFIEVLTYIYKNINCKIINMSLGLVQCENRQTIEDLCLKITHKGTLIISAFDNAGAVSYPAAFPFVIGVDSSTECVRKSDYILVENSIIDIMGFSRLQRVKWLEQVPFAFVSGSSFAAANITQRLITYMLKSGLKSLDHPAAKKILAEGALKTQVFSEKKELVRFPKIKKAIAFPVNKEITSLVNYSQLLPFDLVDLYDFRVTGKVNKNITSIYKHKSFVIKDVDSINWEEDFDTVIIGHVHELEKILNFDIISAYKDKCSKYHKQMICFDFLNEFDEKDPNIYYTPSINNKHISYQNGKLALINTPVLGVWGTSSHQGKFTVQLFLRNAFLDSGYKVAQLSTEPSGFLFGMDSIIPMGYNSSINMNFRETICYVNQEMHRLETKCPDIILVGAQSNTTVYFPGNIAQYPTAQLELLLGSMPDAVLLCVNAFDDVEYIQRTINTIESVSYAKVLALGLYPLSKKTDYILSKRELISDLDIMNIKEKLKSCFSRPVFTIGDECEMNSIYDFVIKWFSEEGESQY